MKIKILFKKFFLGPKCGPGWVKNGNKGYFHASHLTPNPAFPKSKVLNSYPDTKEEIFSMSLLKSVLPVSTNQAERFISRGIGCSYFCRNLLLSFLSWHGFKVLVKLREGGTFFCLSSSVNFQQKWLFLIES